MRRLLAIITATCILSANQVNADALAPAPQIIATYDRSFIERSGAQTFGEMLDTGIIRYFFTGGRNLLVMLNGRPWTTTAGNLDSLPLSAIERIEVLRAESLGTLGGAAAVRGAFNLVLRKDLDGFDVRTVTRLPSRDGGDALQGSAVWGGKVGTDGHMTVSVDILDRQEIVGSTREHSRSEWTEGGSFAEAKNVSVGGNTVYILDSSESELRSVALGDCLPEHGYTGELSNPPGIASGDKGCGFAYGNLWWNSASYSQENTILNLNQPLGEDTELHVDANVTQGRSAFRYAPSVGIFSITPDTNLLASINSKTDSSFTAESGDSFAVAHRFIGHGNRDWKSKSTLYDVSASVKGSLTERLGYDARIEAYRSESSVSGDTFVHTETITQEIAAGRYDLTDPLSIQSDHLTAIEISSVREEENSSAKTLSSRFSLEGTGPGIGGRKTAWTAGVEFSNIKAHSLLAFRSSNGETHDVNEVLGSGGTSYAGERDQVGAFAEVSLPITNSVDMRAATRADKYNDVGGLRAWRLGAEYLASDTVTLRSSWSTGDSPLSMRHLYSFEGLDHPYVLCVPTSAQQRTCDTINFRQVKRKTSGNPELNPSRSDRRSIGFETRRGPFYFFAEWYRLQTSDSPGQNSATWAILNYPDCDTTSNSGRCVDFEAGDITIQDNYANIVNTEILGVNTRFGNRVETDWGHVATRGFWRYVTSSEASILDDKEPLALPRNAVRIVNSVGRGDFTAYWAFNYRDEIDTGGGGRFSSWTGHDLTFDWKKPFGLEKSRLTAGVYNVTDTQLSLNTVDPSSTDGPRAAGWGRTFFVTLNMRF